MKIAIMQPYFFPYIGYYQVIHAVDKYLLYGELNYLKKGWVNRNRILGPNGKPAYINAAIKDRSSHKKINKIELFEPHHWKRKFLRSVFYNYGNSPFFDEVYALIENAMAADSEYLSELNKRCVVSICEFLEIHTQIEPNENAYASLETRLSSPSVDLRSEFPGLRLKDYRKKVVRVLEICAQENAGVFINAIGGRTLYNKDEFKSNGVDLYFIETQPFTYPQRAPEFVPDLSIIDVLMNCGKEGTRELLEKYTLV